MTDDKKDDVKGEEEKVDLKTVDMPLDNTEVDIPDDMDSSKVKFLKNGGADAHVDIVGADDKTDEFVGLTKDELMAYASDPFWVRTRIILLVLFWVVWFGMLAAAVVIIVLAPRCPPRPDLQWWQKSSVYQCQTRSFKDSSKDGAGDLKGVESKLNYLVDLNISAVHMSPLYESAIKDYGYDVLDYKKINPSFGSIEDFRSMLRAMHRRGIKLIMDFIPNHTSKNHTWFQESRKSKDNDYADFYVWVDGVKGVPPSNWLSVYGGSAWAWDETRGQYYLHQFMEDQPDLNLRNPKVKEELKNAMKYWLEEGVDGFRIVDAAYLFESNLTSDEPTSGKTTDKNNYNYLTHVYTTNQPETYQTVTEWRSLLDQYSSSEDRKYEYRVLLVDGNNNMNSTAHYYEHDGKKGADLPLNPNLFQLDANCGGSCVFKLVDGWMTSVPTGRWANWRVGDANTGRIASRIGQNKVNAANMLMMMLPGTVSAYYGDEIGMENVDMTFEETKDPVAIKAGKDKYKEFSRDPQRTPMQWNNNANAGFTDAGIKPWLPVSPNYVTRNVEVQGARGAGHTNIEVFNEMTVLRMEPSLQWGTMKYVYVNSNVFSFVRQAQGFPGFLVAINFGKFEQFANFHAHKPGYVPAEGEIVANTDKQSLTEFPLHTKVSLDKIFLKPGEGVVFKFPFEDRFLKA